MTKPKSVEKHSKKKFEVVDIALGTYTWKLYKREGFRYHFRRILTTWLHQLTWKMMPEIDKNHHLRLAEKLERLNDQT